MPAGQVQVKNCKNCSPDGGRTKGSGMVVVTQGDGVTRSAQACPTCGGNGQVPTVNGFPVPYWYVFGPFNAQAATPGQLIPITQQGGSFQKQIANESDFETLFIMGRIFQGDSRFVQLQLKDIGSNFLF